ncbi:MAG: NAD(P)-binding protein [Rhodocyclaceae bacterium]|jgi:NADPH-dependent glutamate synthase beta subunit-like oxidoreductase/Pyruvate/2-oxoacid:ferredoxin oxidoreductase delta subunit|nr:NAD(P)-binding protein [Rhodocyclaceae bacterium]
MQDLPQDSIKQNYRRYKEGDDKFVRWQDKIFQGDWSYKCPTYVLSSPPCQGSCPAGEDIRGYLNIVRGIEKPPHGADGKPSMPMEEYAWRRITDANPFPAIMGRVCPAPCQGSCNRSKVDDFVGINSVEHYIGDWAIEHGLSFAPPAQETGKRIAIIGGGVAGLSCAYQLRRKGHACTVFESSHKLGGMIIFGLPGYRASRDVVNAEVKRILDMGVEVRLNTRVGRDVSMAELKRHFDAVFIGIGASQGNRLDVPGADAPNCIDGLTFLREFNDGRLSYAGKRIVVIGGGNTAMDCASVAMRLGSYSADAEVSASPQVIVASPETAENFGHGHRKWHWRKSSAVVIAYRRQVREMPASMHEIDAVLEEGADIQSCVLPLEVVKDEFGMAKALRVVRVEWVDRKMVPQPGTEYDIECDLIVAAVGQSVNWSGMDKFRNERGLAKVDKNLMADTGVFVGGDAIKPLLLTTAIGQGRIAAEGIERYLAGAEINGRPRVDVKHFSVTGKMIEFGASFASITEPILGTDTHPGGVHNFEDRSPRHVIPAEALYLGHFAWTPRNERTQREINENNVLGSLEERLVALEARQVQAEAKRCMSCGLCFECDNCMLYCPQGAVTRVPKKEATTGRYVVTDYSRCVGCHICADVCPTGYIQMGMGEG